MIKVTKNVQIGGGRLVLIAGPCVAESLELCLEIAAFLKAMAGKLEIPLIFKASYDKANRTSVESFRGKGFEAGLEMLEIVKKEYGLPVLTDVHEVCQVARVAEVADVVQIPAFLCRQTDLLLEAGRAAKVVNIKKGQFMAPEDMKSAVEKVRNAGNDNVMLTERGTTFGYHNLVVDMRGLTIMREFAPVVFDATHSVQLPGGQGTCSGGHRQFVAPLARAAAAVGIDALFLEVHPRPFEALSDGPNSLPFDLAADVVKQVKDIHELSKRR